MPSNIDVLQSIDDFILQIMNRSEVAVDLSLTKIQQKVINVFGPLCRVWQYIEDAKNSSGSDVVIPLHQIAEDMDKSVLLLGQAFQASTYHHCFNALSAMVKDNRKIKDTLKEKGDLLQTEHKKLFGEKFQTYITDTVKLRQKSEELLRHEQEETCSTALSIGPPTTR